jgi:cell division protein FtsB
MTPRRGSLHYKIVRLARVPRVAAERSRKRWRIVRLAATIAGRCLLLVAILFVTGAVAMQIWRVSTHNLQLHQQIAQVELDNATIQSANDKLSLRVERLHDPEYLVPLIHDQLGLVKPHEVLVQLTQASPVPAAPK